MRQESRESLWSATFYVSWGVALALTWFRVNGTLGQQWGALILLWLGFAISASVRLSRMRLQDTMLQVYRAGIESAKIQAEERAEMERRIARSNGNNGHENNEE